PSVDELASALKSAARLTHSREFDDAAAWPVLGVDGAAQKLAESATGLAPREALAVVGPRRSGRSTLVRRLSWSLGVSGAPVAYVERGDGKGLAAKEVVELELNAWGGAEKPAK